MKKNIKELPKKDRPYEKCMEFGVDNLSDSELLAIIIRTGTNNQSALDIARELLKNHNDDLYNLNNVSLEELKMIDGVGQVKAIQILSAIELGKRLSKAEASKQLDFSNASTVAHYYMEELRHKKVEYFKACYLDCKNNLIKDITISKGTINFTIATPRDVFAEGLKCNASKVIIMHNHPSGNPTPSDNDIDVTTSIYEAGELLGIKLIDHIIIGDKCYYSFSENNYL